MLFRALLGGVSAIGLVVGWILASGGQGFVLGMHKDEFARAAEEGGLDVSACKERSVFNPSGGMEKCVQGVYRDMERQIDEINAEGQNGVGETVIDDTADSTADSGSEE
jgi:hypothetical protein